MNGLTKYLIYMVKDRIQKLVNKTVLRLYLRVGDYVKGIWLNRDKCKVLGLVTVVQGIYFD